MTWLEEVKAFAKEERFALAAEKLHSANIVLKNMPVLTETQSVHRVIVTV